MTKQGHGGKRERAGRKARFNEPTKRVRVPQSCVPAVNEMLNHWMSLKQVAPGERAILRPVEQPPVLKRPLFASTVPAGFPSPADDYIEGRLDLNEYFITHPAATFYVRVTGESMTQAGIFPGDILIVDRALEPVHGAIVIAVVNNELTVKRLYCKDGRVELHPENPDYPVITFTQETELVIWGVVSGVTRKL